MEPKLNNIIPIVLISWSFAFDFFFFPALQCSSESLCLLIFLEKPTSLEASVYTVVLQSPRWLSISISITLDIFSQSKVVVTFRAIYIFNHLSPWVALCLCLCCCLCFSLSLCLCLCLSLSLCLCLCFSLSVCLSLCFSLSLCLCFSLSICFCFSLSLCLCFSLSFCLCFSVCLCLSISFSLTFVVGTVSMFSLPLGRLGSRKSHKGRQGENCEQLHVVSCFCV